MEGLKLLWPVADAHASWGLSGPRSMVSLAALVTPARWVTSLEAEARAGRASMDGAANGGPWEAMTKGIGMGTI
jgi:hypothetical protein